MIKAKHLLIELVNESLIQLSEQKSKAIEESKDLKPRQANIYFIYVDGELKYIGQRKMANCGQRLRQHLIKCPKGTGSKRDLVQEAIDKGQKVTFKTLLVDVDAFRTAIEEEFIRIEKPEWNIHGKRK